MFKTCFSNLLIIATNFWSKMNVLFRSVARFISGKLLPVTAYPVLKGPLKGKKFVLKTLSGKGGGASVYLNLIEPLQTQNFVKTIRPGDIIFDVGANVGYYTVLSSLLTGPQGKVFSFEPLIRNVYYLHRHIIINKLQNVNIVSAACSDNLSISSFFEAEYESMGYIEESEIKDTSIKQTIVPTLTLDSVAEKIGKLPQVLKIDVEGAELLVLKGAQKIISTTRPAIFLSLHSEELKENCLRLLSESGYRFEPLQDTYETSMEFLCTHS